MRGTQRKEPIGPDIQYLGNKIFSSFIPFNNMPDFFTVVVMLATLTWSPFPSPC